MADITYCADQCTNKKCERHLMNVPKGVLCSYAHLKDGCDGYIKPKTINELIDEFEWFKTNK